MKFGKTAYNSMKILDFDKIDLMQIGHTTQIAGVVWVGKDQEFITQIPGKDDTFEYLQVTPMTLDQWTQLNRQADLLETEIFQNDPTGVTKIILRKSQRQLDNFLQWAVFARDFYTCRYCGRINTQTTPLPLSCDHCDLWEDGGLTTLENLITACKPCNKDRGRMQYEDWLKSPIYEKKSRGLNYFQKQQNEDVLLLLPELRNKRVKHVRSR